jgi:hypothetical protein
MKRPSTKMKYHDEDAKERSVVAALFFTKNGDLDLTWLFVFIMGMIGSYVFLHVNVFQRDSSIIEKVVSWSFLAGAFSLIVLAAIPLAKTKVLADAKLPGEMAKNVGDAAKGITIIPTETSTDVQELVKKQQK